jgi:hypothetical protein
VILFKFPDGTEKPCPLARAKESAAPCAECNHSDVIGFCYHPEELTKPKTPVRVWLPALQRYSDEVEMRGKKFYDKDGNVVKFVKLSEQKDSRLIEKEK